MWTDCAGLPPCCVASVPSMARALVFDGSPNLHWQFFLA